MGLKVVMGCSKISCGTLKRFPNILRFPALPQYPQSKETHTKDPTKQFVSIPLFLLLNSLVDLIKQQFSPVKWPSPLGGTSQLASD